MTDDDSPAGPAGPAVREPRRDRLEWFRCWTEARLDNKLRILADDEHRVWFDLLCYAAEQRGAARGTFDASDLDFLAIEVARADRALLERTLSQLQRLRIVAISPEGQGTYLHWADRQYDKPSALPERVRERVAAHRERQRHVEQRPATPSNATPAVGTPLYNGGNAAQRPVTPSNAAVTPSNVERREEKRREEKNLQPAIEVLSEGVQGEPSGVVAPAPPAATIAPPSYAVQVLPASAAPAATGARPLPATAPPPATTLPVPRPNKLGELTDLIRAAGLPYEPTPADGRALKTSRLAAAQIAACYVALACGEFGDDWQRDHLCAATAITAYNAWQTAQQVPPVLPANAARRTTQGRTTHTTMVDHIAARLAAVSQTAAPPAPIESTEPEAATDGRYTVIDLSNLSPRAGPTDCQLPPARQFSG